MITMTFASPLDAVGSDLHITRPATDVIGVLLVAAVLVVVVQIIRQRRGH